MTLKDFLALPDRDRMSFAKEIGVTAEAVRLWESGQRMPRAKHLAKIAQVTSGEVTANDFFSNADAA